MLRLKIENKNYPLRTKRSGFSLAFDRAAGDALYIIALHTHKQRYDNCAYDKRARAKDSEVVVKAILFGINHFEKPQ